METDGKRLDGTWASVDELCMTVSEWSATERTKVEHEVERQRMKIMLSS